jgi:hypothetical protein
MATWSMVTRRSEQRSLTALTHLSSSSYSSFRAATQFLSLCLRALHALFTCFASTLCIAYTLPLASWCHCLGQWAQTASYLGRRPLSSNWCFILALRSCVSFSKGPRLRLYSRCSACSFFLRCPVCHILSLPGDGVSVVVRGVGTATSTHHVLQIVEEPASNQLFSTEIIHCVMVYLSAKGSDRF